MRNKWSLLVAILLVLFVNCLVQALNDGDKEQAQVERLENGEQKQEAFSLMDFNSYRKLFNKSYSSPLQTLARQRIFLTNNFKVFLTNARYKLSNMGYYSVINKFSDLTPEEEQRKLSGDGGEYASDDEDDDQEDLMDEEQLEATLMKALEEQQKQQEIQGNHEKRVLSRRRRSLLNLSDLIRVPGMTSSKQDEEQPEIKIKWFVASNNPDYKPVEHMSYGTEVTGGAEVDKVEDIPEEEANAMSRPASWYATLSPLKSVAGLVESSAKMTYNWLSRPAELAPEVKKVAPTKAADQVIVDWRKSGCVAPPMEQGNCQSCYAVSSMAFLEWAFCMNRERVLTPLSVQYMVSCGPQFKKEADPKLKIQFYGCDRGRSRQAMYFIKNYGAELAVNMPYLARDTHCPVDPDTPLKSKGYIRPNVHQHVRMLASTSQLELALKVGPVIVNFREPVDFLAYGGGMVGRCYQRGGHAMLVVGHGIENNTPYLIIKNSFGTTWGMGGYFKFDRKYTTDCIKDFILPRVSFPSKKSQARRVKAYLAGHQKAGSKQAKYTFDLDENFDVGAGGLFSVK